MPLWWLCAAFQILNADFVLLIFQPSSNLRNWNTRACETLLESVCILRLVESILTLALWLVHLEKAWDKWNWSFNNCFEVEIALILQWKKALVSREKVKCDARDASILPLLYDSTLEHLQIKKNRCSLWNWTRKKALLKFKICCS